MFAKSTPILHTFWFALYPILFLYEHNKFEVSFSVTLVPLLVTLAGVMLLFFMFKLLLNNTPRAALLVSILLVLFFSYGHVLAKISGFSVGSVILGRDRNLIVIYGMLFILSFIGLKKKKGDFLTASKYLNIVSSILVIFIVANIVIYSITREKISNANNTELPKAVKNPVLRPDIYYFILDAYSRADVLKELYDFDNSEFITYLENKGFYVASKSRSNYAYTILSLASSLNMKKINYLSDLLGKDSMDFTIPNEMIANNRVINFLKSKGYKYIHFSSGIGATEKNVNADINVNKWNILNSFMDQLISTTMIQPIIVYFYGPDYKIRNTILHNFEEFGKIIDLEGPKFTFFHVLSPHVPPYAFDKNGDLPKARFTANQGRIAYRKQYIDQLIFINKKMKSLIDLIFENSKDPPVILLQSDHGGDMLKEWDNPSDLFLKERMSILNAYYLPHGGHKKLYETISPVNSFRIIFNHYLGTDLDLLPDESFFSNYSTTPYKFSLVPEHLNH